MTSSIIFFLGSTILIIVIGIIWTMVRLYSQDQRLRNIGEKLETQPNPALLLQYFQEHTQKLSTIISMLEKEDIENSLRVTNNSLDKVLWALRFDEDKYAAESTSAIDKNTGSGDAKNKSISMASEKDSELLEDSKYMKAILKNTEDSYEAMLKYMQETGKDANNALLALDNAEGLHSR